MKILILAEYYEPFIMGGGEISLQQMVNGLISKGHSVYVLTPNCKEYIDTQLKLGNLIIHRYKSIKYKTYSSKKGEEVYTKSKGFHQLLISQFVKVCTWEMVREAKKVLKHNNFDVIHSNNIESMLALSKLKTKIKKVAHVRDLSVVSLNYFTHEQKYVFNTKTNIIKDYYNTNWLIAKLLIKDVLKRRIKALKKIDNIIAINNYVKQQVGRKIKRYDNIDVLYNPINNISKLTKTQAKKKLNIKGKQNVLFVGSLTNVKGANYICDIAYSLPNVNFIIVGNGPYREDLEDSGLDNIDFRGKVKNVSDYYKACDILLLPQTVHYGIGRVAIEAMQNGLPIVSTNIEGINEFVINSVSGALIYNWTVKNFVNTINYLLQYKYKYYMSYNAKILVKGKFDIKNIVNKLEKIYRSVINEKVAN